MPTIKFDDDIIHTYNSFKKIQKLENYNEITYLNCCWNNLSNLPPELPNSLTELWCNDNTLYNLPELPDSLTFLYCSNNNLSSLSELPHSLTHLYVYNNNLSSLPELPQSLTYLYCDNNILSDLPELPNSLIFLYCNNNCLSDLPELPNSLNHIKYHNNPIYTHIEHCFNGDIEKYFEFNEKMKKLFINKIENWFLDCKYNPKYTYCRKRLMKEYKELYG